MKVKLTRAAILGGRKVRVVKFRDLSVADIARLAEISAGRAANPDQAVAEMIAVATGLPPADFLALPIDDFCALMEAVADLSGTAADRIERTTARTVGTARRVH